MGAIANLSLTRRAALVGAGAAALTTMTPVARALPFTWLWVGEKVAEGCLSGLGAGAIVDALRGLRGPDVVHLHEESLRQVAQTMRQELHVEKLAQINLSIDVLVRTLHEYRAAPEGLDRLEFATDRARSLVAQCEKLCESDVDGQFWLPGLASLAPAVSLNIAILQERAKRFRSRGENCNIQRERERAGAFVKRWRTQRGLLLKQLVTEPQQVMLGVDGIKDILPRMAVGRLWVWTCEVEGQTTRLDVNCGGSDATCSAADERLEAQRLAQGFRDTINTQRFKRTEEGAGRLLRKWSKLSSCGASRVRASNQAQPRGSLREQSEATPAMVEAAVVQHMPQPVYPRRALEAERTGRVTLRFTIDIDGSVRDVTIGSVTPHGWGFEQAASDALRRARCRPKMVDGVPVRTNAEREVIFNLSE